MKKWGIITIIILTVSFILAVILLTIKKNINHNPVNPVIEIKPSEDEVVIFSKDEKKEYGKIWVEKQKITTNITEKEILSFINSNKRKWETSVLEYPTGGKTAEGNLWDGVAKTDITKNDFLRAVYVEADEKLGKKYSVHLD